MTKNKNNVTVNLDDALTAIRDALEGAATDPKDLSVYDVQELIQENGWTASDLELEVSVEDVIEAHGMDEVLQECLRTDCDEVMGEVASYDPFGTLRAAAAHLPEGWTEAIEHAFTELTDREDPETFVNARKAVEHAAREAGLPADLFATPAAPAVDVAALRAEIEREVRAKVEREVQERLVACLFGGSFLASKS